MTSVVLTSIFGGLRPGLVDTAISTILAFLVAPPAWTLYVSEPEDRWRIGLFAVLGCFISFVVDAVGQLHRRQIVMNQALASAEKLATVGKFASTLAHHVNNPLEATTNLLFLIETAEDLSTARSYAQAALQQTMRAAHFAHKTLSFAKPADRQHNVELVPLIDNVIALYRNSIHAKDVRVLMRCPRGIYAHANPSEILQVTSILLSNALDAIQEGGTLYIRLARSKNGSIRLVIGDTGCGIAKENFPKLFDAFFTTKAEVGVGLGLWVHKADCRCPSGPHSGA